MKQGMYPLFRNPNAGPGAYSGIERIDGKLGEGCAVNPTITKFEEKVMKAAQTRKVSRTGRPFKTMKGNVAALIPKYSDIAEELHKLQRLPAIVFIFSRAGCDDFCAIWLVTHAVVKIIKMVASQKETNIFQQPSQAIPKSGPKRMKTDPKTENS